MISGLTNGVPGRIITIKNASVDNLVILEKNNPASALGNRFQFYGRGAYFLFPNESVTLLHNGAQWVQFSGQHNNGHMIFDDMLGVNFNTSAAGETQVGFLQASGSGSGARNETGGAGLHLGNVGLFTGSTATGSSSIRSNPRASSSGFYLSGTAYNQVCVIGRIRVESFIPVTGQDFRVILGLNASALNTPINIAGFNGWKTELSNAGFWANYVSNTANTIISEVVTTVPINLNVIVLCTYHINNGDCIFIYSTDGFNYVVATKYTKVTGNFGGMPMIAIQKVSGTTNVTMHVDYMGVTVKQGPQ
jgi:hypothetical protein